MYMNIKEIDVNALAERINTNAKTLQLIDVREHGEIAQGTVPGAGHMPLATIPLRMHEIPKDEEVVLICRSGARSAQACMYLMQQGYKNVINLRGGLMEWARAGLPAALPQTA